MIDRRATRFLVSSTRSSYVSSCSGLQVAVSLLKAASLPAFFVSPFPKGEQLDRRIALVNRRKIVFLLMANSVLPLSNLQGNGWHIFLTNRSYSILYARSFGEMAERFNATVLKTVVGQPTQGSNPCLSASNMSIISGSNRENSILW